MSDAESVVLAELPEQPKDWRRVCVLHLNFGGGKGAAVYEIRDEQGRKVEGIAYRYDTSGTPSQAGFTIGDNPEHYRTWAELRAAYAKAHAE